MREGKNRFIKSILALFLGQLIMPVNMVFASSQYGGRDPEYGYFLLGVILISMAFSIWNYARIFNRE